MRDRLSTKILSNGATRYGVYDETGNLLRYEYIKLEDEPTVEGDLFSKANMLPDSIPAALGLKMSNPQVKDALNVLANVGNLHVWERVQSGVTYYLTSTDRNAYPDESSDGSSYLLGESESKQVSEYYDTGTTRYLNLSYSDSVVISGDGSSVELNNPTTVKIGANASANFNVAKGKFCKFFQTSDTSVTVSITDLVFIPSDAKFSLTYPNSRYTVTCSKVQSVTVVPCTITYLGQLGGGARIEVGSYVGTGTYGSGNKNTLTFKNKRPKKVTVVPKAHNNNSQFVSGYFPFVNGATSAVAKLLLGAYTSRNVNLSWSDYSVSWYSTEAADIQLNTKATTYFYVAEF